jgi:P-type Cu2+ transporter
MISALSSAAETFATTSSATLLSQQSPSTATQCRHCDAVVIAAHGVVSRDPSGETHWFCCHGCAVVFAAIAQFDLGQFYSLSEKRTKASSSNAAYLEFDDPVFASHHLCAADRGNDVGVGPQRISLYVENLRCVGCMWLVESTPRCLAGVREVTVDFAASRADIVFDASCVKLSAIARHLDRLGHPVHPYRGMDRVEQRRREDRAMLLRLGVAGAAVGNLMLLAIALYAGMFGAMATRDVAFFRWASMLVAVPTLGYAAMPFFRTAVASLRSRRLHLDLPLSIGIVAGLGWGSANVLRGVGEIYFDSLAMLVFLLLFSRWLVARQQRRASVAGELLFALTPRTAHRVARGDQTALLAAALMQIEPIDIPIEALACGDIIRVGPGEVIAVDGEVQAGRSAVDTSVLNGESALCMVGPGDVVAAGTANSSQPLWIKARAIGEATRIGQLARFIDEVGRRKAPIEKLVDGLTGRFVAVVLSVAVIVAVAWGMASSWSLGFEHAMALLVVTCPCALALATPVAMAIAVTRAARQGILIKGADAMECLSKPGVLFLDKTGTITEGRSKISMWRGDVGLQPWVAALETWSKHPIAQAIATQLHGTQQHQPSLVVDNVVETFGFGIEGTVATHQFRIGAPTWILQQPDSHTNPRPAAWSMLSSDQINDALATMAAQGASPVLVSCDGAVVAALGLTDTIRPQSAQTVRSLQLAGWQVELLSGDHQSAVDSVARAIGVTIAVGQASPEAKLARVQRATAHGATVFVGDGINDAAALAAATCGIAVSGSAEVAMESAGVFLSKPGIAQVAHLLDGAKRTIATIERNFRISLLYNCTAGGLAISGIIHPLIAALFMPLSSASVLLSSSLSRGFTTKDQS